MQRAAEFVGSEFQEESATAIGVRLSALDARLQLQRCGSELDIFWPHGKSRKRVLYLGVRCSTPQPWTVYLQAHLSEMQSSPVLSRSVRKGEVFDPVLIEYQLVDRLQQSQPVVQDINSVVGQEFKRSVRKGALLAVSVLQPPVLVKRGERLTVRYVGSTIRIQVAATALADGRRGDRIDVRNLQSNRVIQATVIGRGEVSLQL